MKVEGQERQRLQLLHAKDAQVVRASQDDQGGKMKQAVNSPNGGSNEAEDRRKQSEAPVHRPKQVV